MGLTARPGDPKTLHVMVPLMDKYLERLLRFRNVNFPNRISKTLQTPQTNLDDRLKKNFLIGVMKTFIRRARSAGIRI
jgi:hypothetical protein